MPRRIKLNILALDTSTEYCSAALLREAGIASREELAGQRHSELVLPMIEDLLKQTGLSLDRLDGIAFGAGPGSFTGLRIACGVAQGLALGAGVPVVPVGTLLALAQASGASRVLACLDARMGEIYHAAYVRDGEGWEEAVAPNVCRADQAPDVDNGGWIGIGSGFATYASELAARYGGKLVGTHPNAYPHARAIAELARPRLDAGGGFPAEQAVPLYVRDRVALKMHEQR
jgi:tRNA threonylcarbamoyladenosine biosynthesis protein TsaB